MNCRACSSANIESIIPLGLLPLANRILKEEELHLPEPKYNLEVMLCQDCNLAQLRDLVPPKELFSEYVYFSSNSDTMLKSAENLVDRLFPELTEESFIIEIASNDGYLLKNYIKKGFNVLGIDPARNIAQIANENGVPTLCEFFEADLAHFLVSEGKLADVIHANNVMAHVPDINGFIEGIKILLKPRGFAVIEVPYFLDLVEKNEFDTIYHEHVYYFGLKALKTIFSRCELEIFNLEKLTIHGGTLRLFASHKGAKKINPLVDEMEEMENQRGLYNIDTYVQFMDRLQQLKMLLKQYLNKLKGTQKKIAAYGASAKGTTLLNYFDIGKDFLDFVVDKSSIKIGCYTPGTHLEILSPDKLCSQDIDYALLLVWNFAEEIIAQQKQFINKGGKILVPLPEVREIA